MTTPKPSKHNGQAHRVSGHAAHARPGIVGPDLPGTTGRHFIFCTGIENSYPIITTKAGKLLRRDGMRLSDHYNRWREDFDLVRELGITFLRYGPPLYTCHQGPMKYDWSFADKTFKRLRQMEIHPIADLCHFGVPDWIGSFQNPEWPPLFADYAREFAKRFEWVRYYTPVNEIYVCARFSAKLGWWNEQLKSDRAFVTALKNMCKANLLAEEAILEVQPAALFVQSESSEYFHPSSPATQSDADFYNQFRFLALDLCYGNDVSGLMHEYLMDNGMSRGEYHWFLEHGQRIRPHCVMGNDYYITNEHEVADGGDIRPSGEIFGYYVITHQYFDRYHLPVMHTETNRKDDDQAAAWLWKEWNNVLRLRADGVPILGFTWYSLLDQTDWDTALREDNHRIDPMGLFDLNRKIRKVGEAYRELIAQWRDQLLAQSMCRDILLSGRDVSPVRQKPIDPRVAREMEDQRGHSSSRMESAGSSRQQAQELDPGRSRPKHSHHRNSAGRRSHNKPRR